MGRVSIVLLLSLLVWASGTASTLGQGGRVDITQVDITRFPEVTVFFRVLDSSGKSLGQLCCDKVDVEEDGRRARILQILDKGSFPITTALVVDCSGSMADAVAGATKLDAAKKACHEFLKLSRPTDKNCLIQFNTVATVVCQFEAPLDHLHRSVDALQAGGNTAWRDAVVEALNMLAVRQGRRSVILLTDGQDNSSVRSIALVIENARKIQVPVYAIALGEYHQIDERELRQLAQETGGSYLLMPSPAQLAQLYEEMAKSLQEEVAVTYITNRPYPDGTRRRIRLSVQIGSTVFSGEGSYLEPHVLNPGSHFGVFLFWLVVLGLCYAGPFALDAHRKQAFRRACKEAFREESDENKVVSALLPRGELVTQVHPKAVLREAAPRVVSVRIDTILRPPEGTTILHQPLHLIVLLDLSASMEGERLIAAYSAIESLVGGMANRDSFCLVGFSDTASLVVPPIRIQSGRKLILSQLKDLSTGARTILAPALEMVPSLLPPARSSNQRRTCAVIVSDGMIEDRFPALETARQLSGRVEIYAMGIGADYDHELLADLCGDKHKVDHLDTAQEAAGAFERFMRLFGHTVTARTRLRFRTSSGVILKSVTAQRYAKDLPIVNDTVTVGDLTPLGALTYLAEFEFWPSTRGTIVLGSCALVFDLPAYGKSDCESETSLVVEVTEDPARANVPNPEVVRVARTIQAIKLAEKAEEHVRSGDLRTATQKLKQATRRLEELGEHEKARALDQLRDRIEAEPENADLGIKRIRGTTKRLTE